MKLRNKKTGEIVDLIEIVRIDDLSNEFYLRLSNNEGKTFKVGFNSITELNAEWEDAPEEPKTHYSITQFGDVGDEVDGYMSKTIDEMKEIGNYFETKEEAEKAVEKLKAVKRLKDKGSKIIDYECYGGTNTKGEFSGEVKVTIDVPQDVDKYLLKMLFGDEG